MSRRTAYDILQRVEQEGAFSHLALDAELRNRELSPEDRRLATRLVYGVLTWRKALDSVLDQVVDGGVRRLDASVLQALRIGAYQLCWLDRIPDHAAVDETVRLVESAGWERASGLVNAVLRELAGRQGSLRWWDDSDRDGSPVGYLSDRYSLPMWIANRLQQLYPFEEAESLAESWTERPPMFVRRLSGTDTSELEALDAKRVPGVPSCWRVDKRGDEVRALAKEGGLAIQDLGSQLVGQFVGAEPGDRVLDACAGLGGKTMQLAEHVGEAGDVVAVDRHGGKLERLATSLESRTSFKSRVELRHSDLSTYVDELHADGENAGFDRVLVDAPCSALGTIRRHPEIRWRRREADIPELVQTQRDLLETASRAVAEGGVIVYAVCTFLTEEGRKQIDRFVERNDEFSVVDPPSDDTDWTRYIRQGMLETDPVRHGADMFFAARLRKESH